LLDEVDHPASRDGGDAGDLVPGEPAAQPARRGDDGGLAASVVDRLILVVLAVELDEEPQLRPGEVDASHELAVGVRNAVLAFGRREAGDRPHQLDHQRLEKALGRWRAGGPLGEDPPDSPRPALALRRRRDLRDRDHPAAEGGLQCLLPPGVVEDYGKVDQGLQGVRAPDPGHDDDPLRRELPTLSPRPGPACRRRNGDVQPVEGDIFKPMERSRERPARNSARRNHGRSRAVHRGELVGPCGVDGVFDLPEPPVADGGPELSPSEAAFAELRCCVQPSHDHPQSTLV